MTLSSHLREVIRRGKTREQAIPLFAVLLLSATLHFAWLSHPASVIFDEVTFGKFINSYCCSHERIFDIHPPHAKLLIAAGARLLGYRGNVEYRAIDEPYGDASPFPVRFVPAVAGTLLPLLVYILMLQLGGSRPAALFAALLVLLDNALILQTRIVGLVGILLSTTLASLVTMLAAIRAQSHARRSAYCFLAGALAAVAVGSKVTGLIATGLIGLCVLVQIASHIKDKRIVWYWLRKSTWIMTGFVIVYGLGWKLHFVLLTVPGTGDAWGLPTGEFLADAIKAHATMLSTNIDLSAGHPDGSPWWGWPVMHTPVFYWAHEKARLYLFGNPVIWWSASVTLIAVLVNLVLFRVCDLKVVSSRTRKPTLWLPIVGFVGAYAPLSQVTRVLLLYHYFTALIFSILTVVLWLDNVGWLRADGLTKQRASVYGYLVLVVVGFVSISPVTYGFDTGTWLVDYFFEIFPKWR